MSTEIKPGFEQKLRFGVFEADLSTGELRRAGVKVRIQSKPFQVLACLLEHPGEMVSREELQKRLWHGGTNVDFDHGLGIAVNKLRDALGDAAENPVFVETLARRGFRFLAPVHAVSAANVLPADQEQPAAAPLSAAARVQHSSWIWKASAALGLATLGSLVTSLLIPHAYKAYQVEQITTSGNVLSNSIELHEFSVAAVDGPRIYFVSQENGNDNLSEALLANGETSRLSLPDNLVNPHLLALSPDGSTLLVREYATTSLDEPLWLVQTLGGNAHKVPGILAHDGVWMPDGRELLIARGTELDVMQPDGAGLHRVATLPNPAFWMRWSPNKRRLRYTVWNQKTRTTSLWEMSAGFTHQHPILAGWSQPSSECCGSWTADGSFYVFQSLQSGHSEIWELRELPWLLHDWAPEQVTNGPLDSSSPVASGSEDTTYYLGVNPQIQLVESTPDQKDFTFFNNELRTAAFVKYSRDGNWVAWLNAADGSLWRSRADGKERVLLVHPPMRVFNMEWSPNNQQLALMAIEPGGPWRIYLVSSEGGALVRLYEDNHQQADPTWTPDGKKIVFGGLGERMSSDQEQSAIYEFDLASHKVEKIPGSENLFSPRLSPDGSSILAMASDQTRIVVYDGRSGHWKSLVQMNVGDPTWSSNGREIYFQNYELARRPIYKVELATGKLSEVASMAMLHSVPASDFRLISLAPNDRILASIRTSTVNVYSIHLDRR